MSRYRATAYSSTVDESLFGSGTPSSGGRSKKLTGPILANSGAAIITQAELRKIKVHFTWLRYLTMYNVYLFSI